MAPLVLSAKMALVVKILRLLVTCIDRDGSRLGQGYELLHKGKVIATTYCDAQGNYLPNEA